MRQLNQLKLNASRYLPGYSLGQRSSLRRRLSAEFHEHRMYVPGDDPRFVDWKASARQEHIFVKQGQQPKEVTVYLLLDCSSSMVWGDPPKSLAMINLAFALSYLALSHGDRLVIVPFSEGGSLPLGPITGKGQLAGLIKQLRSLSYNGRFDLLHSVRDFRRKNALRGGLTFLLSDFLDVSSLSDVLEFLPAPSWDVVVLHLLHPEELKPSVRGNYELQDVETAQKVNYDITPASLQTYRDNILAWMGDLEYACVQNNAFYAHIPTNWKLDVEILPRLRAVNVVIPA